MGCKNKNGTPLLGTCHEEISGLEVVSQGGSEREHGGLLTLGTTLEFSSALAILFIKVLFFL